MKILYFIFQRNTNNICISLNNMDDKADIYLKKGNGFLTMK